MGLAFKTHTVLYHSTLGSRVKKKKKKKKRIGCRGDLGVWGEGVTLVYRVKG